MITMKKTILSLCCTSLFLTACNDDSDTYIAVDNTVSVPTLVAFAKLDVETYAAGPDSGKDVKGANGILPPFRGQPIQGFSAALKNQDGSYMAMSDNGFGAQDNSADYLLRIHHIQVDFKRKETGTGKVNTLSFIQLQDPNHLIPFDIINEKTTERFLTGADFDPESMQRSADGSYWIGDEFGPYLLHFDKNGILLDAPIVLPDPLDMTKELRSPQNQFNKANINYTEARVQRSGGFEGMALSADGQFLYPLLEKPLLNDAAGQLIISQFDLKKKAYTGQYFLFALDSKAKAIGDFQMFNAHEGIIIERDNSQNDLNGYKKLIKIKLGASGQTVQREELVNLMQLDNPNLLYTPARDGDIGTSKVFSFPFETIEDIVIENAYTITVLNDNNFPGSSGRNAKRADDNEVIQIQVAKALF